MKYIRTKDGIITYEKYIDLIACGSKTVRMLNKSDTIEELCDEFVGVDNTCENGHQLLRTIPYKCANYWNGGVYGAVWTTKGLIYVAKLDSEGKLVLI